LLDDSDPVKLRAELKTGLITPDAAIGAAGGHPEILLEAAKMKGDASLEIKAMEALVAAGKIPGAALWQGYLDNAVAFSNHYALLQGNYAAWFNTIAKMDDPYARRSLLAYLSRHALDAQSRDGAVSIMIDSLKDAPRIAVGIFSDSATLSPAARLALGEMALRNGDFSSCTHFWDGLALQGSEPLDLAQAWLKTGRPEKAAATLDQYLKGAKTLDPAISKRMLALARQMASMQATASKDLLTTLAPLVDIGTRREILVLQGDISADPQTAAAYYFEAATLIEAKQGDDLAMSARLACAEHLQKAGFLQDAKAQYKWLLARTKDPAGIREIKRQLQ
jgi:hypothetical protein